MQLFNIYFFVDPDDVQDFSLLLQKEVIPSERQLMIFSKTLAHDCWQSVLYELGLQTSDIDQCKKSNATEKMQCKYGLTLWLRRNGKSATFQTLYKACKNSDVDLSCLSSLFNVATAT